MEHFIRIVMEKQEELSEDDIPLAAVDDLSGLEGKNLGDLPASGEETEISIDLGALQESLNERQKSSFHISIGRFSILT